MPHTDSNGRSLKINFFAFVAVLLLSVSPGFGQTQLYLQHRDKPHRQEIVSLKKEYIIKTTDSTFTKYRIIAFSEEDMLISSILREDTVQIPFNDIERLIKVRKFGLFEAIGTLGLVCLASAPALWATGRSDEASDMMLISGFLFAVSLPVIAGRRIGRKRDIKTKWTIRAD